MSSDNRVPDDVDRSGHGPDDGAIPVPRLELRRLGDEVAVALRAVTEARASRDARDALALVTFALEQLSATQRELVDVLLDHGHTWSEVGEALSTSPAAAERRFPRRDSKRTRAAPSRRPGAG
jgi:hypothetical protein